MIQIRHQGKTYQVADDFPEEDVLDLRPLLPRVLPASWRQQRHPFLGHDSTYGACFTSVRGLGVLISACRYPDGKRWLHVSLSRSDKKLPSWDDLREVKTLFIGEDKTALQVLPSTQKYVNIHPGVLHLWHCLDGDVTPDFTRGGQTI